MFSFVAMIAIFAGLAVVAFLVVRPLFSSGDPQANVSDFPGPGTNEVLVVIPEGATGNEIGLLLKDQGVVATTEAFSHAYSANSAATSIQPGTYRLMQQMAAKDAVAALLDPDNRADVRVTIPEGYRSDQIYQRVADDLGISYDDAYAAAHDYAALGLDGPPNTNEGVIDPMEGWFYPSTYSVPPDGKATDLFKQMYDRTIAEPRRHRGRARGPAACPHARLDRHQGGRQRRGLGQGRARHGEPPRRGQRVRRQASGGLDVRVRVGTAAPR
ncbi:endolytic transglycosylase MltG [Salana multivorans]